ncbi:unnamed protein product [Rangifer tarandus platyrhynchus]|uniref:Uncharacterized protein n=2 Tax=Rangifer tarandus platyrhynchus TaxID=3082113 RepID=A0AC59YCS8_RANTA|nr:unnamed protein product [Rangifer tarandus platyrhynchus]
MPTSNQLPNPPGSWDLYSSLSTPATVKFAASAATRLLTGVRPQALGSSIQTGPERIFYTIVTRVYAPRFFVSSQQKFGVTDIKAPWRVTALGGQTVLWLSGLEQTVL